MDRSLLSLWQLRAALLLFVALVVVACAGSSGQANRPAEAAASAAAGDRTGNEPGSGGGEGGQPAGQPGTGSGEGSGGGDGGEAAGGEGAGTDTGSGTTAAFRDLARIIYTGAMTLEVSDLHDAVRAGRDAVLAAGGYVGASRQSTDEDTATASITYRIPAERWEETLETLRALGSVRSEQIDSSEVTGQIVDLQARIRNLRVSEAAIQAIAEKATTFEEILDGQARLSSVREEIEQLDAQLASLEGQADLGTLTVTYGTKPAPAPPPPPVAQEPAWDPRSEIARATGTLVGMLQELASFAIWFGIVWLPVLVVLLAVAIGVRVVIRRSGALDRLTDPASPTLPGG